MSVIELKNDLGKINNYLSGTQSLQQDRDDVSTVNNRKQDNNTAENRSEGPEGLNAEQDFSSFQDLTEVVQSQQVPPSDAQIIDYLYQGYMKLEKMKIELRRRSIEWIRTLAFPQPYGAGIDSMCKSILQRALLSNSTDNTRTSSSEIISQIQQHGNKPLFLKFIFLGDQVDVQFMSGESLDNKSIRLDQKDSLSQTLHDKSQGLATELNQSSQQTSTSEPSSNGDNESKAKDTAQDKPPKKEGEKAQDTQRDLKVQQSKF